MSAGAAQVEPPSLASGLLSRTRGGRPGLSAFLASRMIVVAAGALGVATTAARDPSAARAARRALGPVGNLLAAPVDRFDAAYYLAIAAHGYGAFASGKVAFFPLYPLLIHVLTPVSGSGVIAGVAISAASFGVALVLLHRLTAELLGSPAADATVLLLCFAPLSFFFTAVYTESLFLALSVGSLYAAHRGRWRLACALGALATLTRPTGVLLALGLAVMRLRANRGLDRELAWVLALPAALLGYLGVLASQGYPLLAPFAAQSHWGRVSDGPVAGLVVSVIWAARGALGIMRGAGVYHPLIIGPFTPAAESVMLLGVLALAGAALLEAARRLPPEYPVLAGTQLLMCLSSPELGQPLWSLDRFTLTMFPLWMAAGAWLARRRLVAPAVAVGAALLAFYTLQFARWAFVA